MTEEQKIHLAMINSYKILTGSEDANAIASSDIPLFSHNFLNGITIDELRFIIDYFTDIEMFEECAGLQKVMKEMFNDDGSKKGIPCKCPHPTVDKYSLKTKCSTCKKRIKL